MTGDTDSWRVQTKLCAYQNQETGVVTPQDIVPDLPVSVQEFLAEVWTNSGLAQGQGH